MPIYSRRVTIESSQTQLWGAYLGGGEGAVRRICRVGRLRLGQANLSLDDGSFIVDIDHVVADRKSNENYDLRSRSHINLSVLILIQHFPWSELR